MTAAEWVEKDFTLKGNTTKDLCKAVTAYVKSIGLEIEEYGFDPCYGTADTPLPEKFWNLVAFNVEGGSEGYYVHIGAIVRGGDYGQTPPTYVDFGFAKMWTPDKAYALANAAQRFLSAIVWN